MNIQKLIENYLDMEAYGSNLIIKEYCKFPKFLPLPCHIEHGWTPKSDALVTDLEIAQEKKMMLVFSKRRKEAWQKKSKIPALIAGPPFILYRKIHNIQKSADAQGTIAFPGHSTIFLENQYDIANYCQKLKQLPKRYHPITICLFYLDIKSGKDKIFRKYGFKVISVGSKVRGSLNFVRNFYQILSQHHYATSNEIGSYTFYAVEMDTPFFLYGDEPITINTNNEDPNISKTAKISDYIIGKKANIIFDTGPSKCITNEQIEFVNYELGINDLIPPEEMKKQLQKNMTTRYWLKLIPIYFVLSLIKFFVPQNIAYWIFKQTNKNLYLLIMTCYFILIKIPYLSL